MTILIYLLLGASAGMLAGLLGIGGGIIIVPLLILTFLASGMPTDMVAHVAVATSLMTITVTASMATYTHHQHQAIDWSLVARLAAFLMLGVGLGVWSTFKLSGQVMQIIIGTYSIIIAIYMAVDIKPNPTRELPNGYGLAMVGITLGAISAILGVAGGVMLVPYLTWCNVAMRHAVATSAACGLPIAFVGAGIHLIFSDVSSSTLEWSTGYIYWPAVAGIVLMSTPFARLGARLAHQWPAHRLKSVFSLVLFGVGLYFHYQNWL